MADEPERLRGAGTAAVPAAEPSFSAALQELEGILRRIEAEETDIDHLAEELRRASVLLELCRGKVRRAELEVTQIVERLEAADS